MERRYLLPGEYHLTKKPMSIDTLLGSCVSVCLFNTRMPLAAMNHFLLDKPKDVLNIDVGRYGVSSIDHIAKTLFAVDNNPYHFTAQIFGGAAVVDSLTTGGDIGERNIAIAQKMLAALKIKITHQDVGGKNGRRIKFDTATNNVQCVYMGQTEEARVLAEKRRDLAGRKLRVLIVDDSATVRKLLRRAIEMTKDMEVVGEAEDAYEARDLVLSDDPDVITLDIIMPKMDGLTFLEKLQKYYPKPVVIVSTIAKDNSKVAQSAVRRGAVDVIDKEMLELYKGMNVVQEILIPKLRSAIYKKRR
jgi:chemotaxis receptor (MCP) glutamine deamidase CheD